MIVQALQTKENQALSLLWMNTATNLYPSTFLKVRLKFEHGLIDAALMEKLKSDLEATEYECEIINRREKLLNFRITKFTAVSNLKADMSPFITLWNIASSFVKVFESKNHLINNHDHIRLASWILC